MNRYEVHEFNHSEDLNKFLEELDDYSTVDQLSTCYDNRGVTRNPCILYTLIIRREVIIHPIGPL